MSKMLNDMNSYPVKLSNLKRRWGFNTYCLVHRSNNFSLGHYAHGFLISVYIYIKCVQIYIDTQVQQQSGLKTEPRRSSIVDKTYLEVSTSHTTNTLNIVQSYTFY